MNRKFKFLLMLISLSICLGIMSSTYSRYVASAKGDINASFSKWQILVDKTDITSNTNSTIEITPTIEKNNNIADNVVAPTSTGYFDIKIDPTNVDVSFKYMINLELNNQNLPDLIITEYTIVPDGYKEEDLLTFYNVNGSVISETLSYEKDVVGFKFKPFTVRVYFEWLEGGINEEMDDDADTAVGLLAVSGNETFNITANIGFEQVITSE